MLSSVIVRMGECVMGVKFKKPPVKKPEVATSVEEPMAKIDIETKVGGKSLKDSYEESIGLVIKLADPHATVGFKAGITKNMGDYNSTRIDVSVFLPTAPTEKGIEAAYEYARYWVDRKMDAIIEDFENQ